MENEAFESWFLRGMAGFLGGLFGWVITNASEIIQLLTILYLLVMIVSGLVGIVRKMGEQTDDSCKEDSGGTKS